jgi:glucose-1-phosphate cytidylyltransferase
MNVVILAGGLGTRLSEETDLKPKPMVEIGGRPILWHIMKHYAHHGFEEFHIAIGYKGERIKQHFMDYRALHSASMSVRLADGRVDVDNRDCENWTVHMVDTGLGTATGGRVKRLQPWLKGGPFCVTYGDGVSDLDLDEVVKFHRKHGRIATVTAVRPPARFGSLQFNGDLVERFVEKPQAAEGWINGGFNRTAIGRISSRGVLAVYGHAPRRATAESAVGR